MPWVVRAKITRTSAMVPRPGLSDRWGCRVRGGGRAARATRRGPAARLPPVRRAIAATARWSWPAGRSARARPPPSLGRAGSSFCGSGVTSAISLPVTSGPVAVGADLCDVVRFGGAAWGVGGAGVVAGVVVAGVDVGRRRARGGGRGRRRSRRRVRLAAGRCGRAGSSSPAGSSRQCRGAALSRRCPCRSGDFEFVCLWPPVCFWLPGAGLAGLVTWIVSVPASPDSGRSPER